MQVKHVRTGKPMRLASPQQFLARERTAVEEAWPGDVIGVMDRGTLRIGDTLSTDGDLEFSGIPRFAPEHFARIIVGRSDEAEAARRRPSPAHRRRRGAGVLHVGHRDVGPDADRRRGGNAPVRRDAASPGARVRRAVPSREDHGALSALGTGPIDEIERIARDRGRMLLYDAEGIR